MSHNVQHKTRDNVMVIASVMLSPLSVAGFHLLNKNGLFRLTWHNPWVHSAGSKPFWQSATSAAVGWQRQLPQTHFFPPCENCVIKETNMRRKAERPKPEQSSVSYLYLITLEALTASSRTSASVEAVEHSPRCREGEGSNPGPIQ